MVAILEDPSVIIPIEPSSSPWTTTTTTTTPEPIYKQVVVIGNGPSGIALSYFLAGNWPYYNGHGESVNEMLHYRLLAANANGNSGGSAITKVKSRRSNKQLQKSSLSCTCCCDEDDPNNNCTCSYCNNGNENNGRRLRQQSIVEQDLNFLAQGLEGRSSNPTSLLFDTLNHPQADLGLELPSLLNWNHDPNHSIDHVVIGKGAPGGTWQSMDGSVLTISLGCWMELPQLNFREWEAGQESRCWGESRATVSAVAQYYCDYVQKHRLGQYFLNDSVITSVVRITGQDVGESGRGARLPVNYCDRRVNAHGKGRMMVHRSCTFGYPDEAEEIFGEEDAQCSRRHTVSAISMEGYKDARKGTKDRRPLWKVDGFTRQTNSESKRLEPFTFLTRNLVLATGASDNSNILNIPGENLPFVLHSINDLEQLILSGHLNETCDPILVVGAGLCAADAVIAAKFHSIPILHIFRRSIDDPNLIFRQLPENMYPEYHKVYQMMRDSSGYNRYKAFELKQLIEVTEDRFVKIVGESCCGKVKVSYVVICIGSHPDLSMLGPLEKSIGVRPGKPIDCKTNPIAINTATHESIVQPGLYGLGPLVGENFVRFLQGGALAITNHLLKLQKVDSQVEAAETSVPDKSQLLIPNNSSSTTTPLSAIQYCT